jgi:pimeloyl-ACP methyl ester carboxylesterase
MSISETPYRISVPDEAIARLQAKLELTTFPDELEEAGWAYGAPLTDIKRLVARWKEGYDWRTAEKSLNDRLPQYTLDVEVEGFGTLNVHYVHKKSDRVNAIPLLFVHGWPGSFIEVFKIVNLLTAPLGDDAPAFHLVAPSLPGYAFSDNPKQKGFGLNQYAETCHKVMLALGYNEYVTQGGDWGSFITRKIAAHYGHKHAKAWHTNLPMGGPPNPFTSPILFVTQFFTLFTSKVWAGLQRGKWYLTEGNGYFKEQSTMPQTLGYGLHDSPVGLLAWIYEKLVLWTDDYSWTDDEVLTWVSIYWFSKAGPAASVRIYYEAVHQGDIGMLHAFVDRPTIPHGASFFPKDIAGMPEAWIKAGANVVFKSHHDKGGHFASYEVPEALVEDLRKMFGKGGPAYAVVGGRNGYDG